MQRSWSWRRLSTIVRTPPFPSSPLDTKRFAYVDKTHLLARILSNEYEITSGVFLHAPAMRRVGKSTTIAMLAAMAKGDMEMFDGMAVSKPDSPFVIEKGKYHVIQLDFSGCASPDLSINEVEKYLSEKLVHLAFDQHDIKLDENAPLTKNMYNLLRELKKKSDLKIVLLIDEYDAPVTTFLNEDP